MAITIVITGASQGIGAAIACRFAKEYGAAIQLALVSRNQDALQTVVERCRQENADAAAFPCDLTAPPQVQTMAGQVFDRFGTPELLISNAGQFIRGDLLTIDVEAFQSVLDVNLTSAFLVTRAFAPLMIARKRGTIFYMASVASTRAYEDSGAYCVAKHGLLGLARSVRESTRESGLRVTAIMPGATDTPSWSGEAVASERLMPTGDIAAMVLSIYQLSDRSVVEEIVLRPLHGDI